MKASDLFEVPGRLAVHRSRRVSGLGPEAQQVGRRPACTHKCHAQLCVIHWRDHNTAKRALPQQYPLQWRHSHGGDWVCTVYLRVWEVEFVVALRWERALRRDQLPAHNGRPSATVGIAVCSKLKTVQRWETAVEIHGVGLLATVSTMWRSPLMLPAADGGRAAAPEHHPDGVHISRLIVHPTLRPNFRSNVPRRSCSRTRYLTHDTRHHIALKTPPT